MIKKSRKNQKTHLGSDKFLSHCDRVSHDFLFIELHRTLTEVTGRGITARTEFTQVQMREYSDLLILKAINIREVRTGFENPTVQ